ncbi:hypothetical protein SDC9_200412 [bioreactor metagenome]|uniref:Uncharacterized protein n=1 Tax=bioreactor metagenome TaxID=1076179 RepID=A0A645INR6_9ZZZZ
MLQQLAADFSFGSLQLSDNQVKLIFLLGFGFQHFQPVNQIGKGSAFIGHYRLHGA